MKKLLSAALLALLFSAPARAESTAATTYSYGAKDNPLLHNIEEEDEDAAPRQSTAASYGNPGKQALICDCPPEPPEVMAAKAAAAARAKAEEEARKQAAYTINPLPFSRR